MFTSLQKAAITQLSFLIISADGKILNSESRFAFTVWRKLGVESADIQAAKKMSAEQAYSIVKEMDSKSRELICAILGCLIVSDGDADTTEVEQWRQISEVCNMPKMTIPDAVRIAHENFD